MAYLSVSPIFWKPQCGKVHGSLFKIWADELPKKIKKWHGKIQSRKTSCTRKLRTMSMSHIEAFDLVFGYKNFTPLSSYFYFNLHHSRYDTQNTGDVVVVCVEEDVAGELLE